MRTARVTRGAAGGADLAQGRASSFTPIVFNGPRINELVRCPERLIQTRRLPLLNRIFPRTRIFPNGTSN